MGKTLEEPHKCLFPSIGKITFHVCGKGMLKLSGLRQRPVGVEVVENLNVFAGHAKESARIHLPEIDGCNVILQSQQARVLPNGKASLVLDNGLEETQSVFVCQRTACAPICRF